MLKRLRYLEGSRWLLGLPTTFSAGLCNVPSTARSFPLGRTEDPDGNLVSQTQSEIC